MSMDELFDPYVPEDDPPPEVLNPPAEIYLIYGDLDTDAEHSECREVTWCKDSQFCTDVRYVRSDIYYEALLRADRLLTAALRRPSGADLPGDLVVELIAHRELARGLRP